MDKKLISNTEKFRWGYKGAWVSIIGNIILFILKINLGLLINSISLIADAIHSLSDTVTSFVVVVGFKISQKPPDKEHPFGHGRTENIAALIISVMLVFVGIGLAQDAFKRCFDPPVVKGNFTIAAIILVTVFIKELMAQYSFRIAKKIDSQSLVADAWHHRFDAISSILVVVALVASYYGHFKVDAYLGIAVAIVIIVVAVMLIKKSSSFLLGKAPKKEMIKSIKEFALSVKGIKGAHNILVHNYGYHNVVSLHIEVAKTLNLTQAHQLATAVENKISNKLKASTVVHVDLHKDKSKLTNSQLKKVLKKILHSHKEIVNYHEVNFLSLQGIETIDFHVTVRYDMPVEKAHELNHSLTDDIKKHLKGYTVNIHIEPCDSKCEICSKNCDKTI